MRGYIDPDHKTLMKKTPETVFQNALQKQESKVETLKTRIAAGEYRIDPHNIAEKLMAREFFKIYRHNSPGSVWF
jgi:anti-sigma28 factor (negative regulator of flagellin synthesis)